LKRGFLPDWGARLHRIIRRENETNIAVSLRVREAHRFVFFIIKLVYFIFV